MKTLIEFLQRIAGWKSLIVALAVYIVFPAYFLKNAETRIHELAGKKIPIIDLSFGFKPQSTLDLVAGYGDAGRAFYAAIEMSTDLVYPIAYAFLFGIILAMLYRKEVYAWVCLLPFGMLLFDYGENISIIYLLKTYPQQSWAMAAFCELFKMMKWLTFGVIFLLVLYGVATRLFRKGREGRS